MVPYVITMKSEASETSPTPEAELPEAVELCRSSEAMLEGLRRVYEQADRSLAGQVCMGGGVCCKFDLCDHRLYVSSGELALLTLDPPPAPRRALLRRCPYQIGPSCAAYDRRPLGCRVFFCRKIGRGVDLHSTYERLHGEIRNLHQSLWLPYAYGAMLEMMTQLSCST